MGGAALLAGLGARRLPSSCSSAPWERVSVLCPRPARRRTSTRVRTPRKASGERSRRPGEDLHLQGHAEGDEQDNPHGHQQPKDELPSHGFSLATHADQFSVSSGRRVASTTTWRGSVGASNRRAGGAGAAAGPRHRAWTPCAARARSTRCPTGAPACEETSSRPPAPCAPTRGPARAARPEPCRSGPPGGHFVGSRSSRRALQRNGALELGGGGSAETRSSVAAMALVPRTRPKARAWASRPANEAAPVTLGRRPASSSAPGSGAS